jgi:ribokinase
MPPTTHVYGPAYLDRVLRVDRSLVGRKGQGPLDRSVDGRLEPGAGLTIVDTNENRIRVALPRDWPGPWGTVHVSDPFWDGSNASERDVTGIEWHDDLGGMGAGYASALGGRLVSALGSHDDPHMKAIAALLNRARIEHRPLFMPDRPSDWTLLLTSGPFGDKLPIGFRGCHAALETLGSIDPCDLRVVASLPNELCAQVLSAPGAGVTLFAPTMRNVVDRSYPIESFAAKVHILTCNSGEWSAIAHPNSIKDQVFVSIVTNGAAGSRVRYLSHGDNREEIHEPAFPRELPPADTNRAGEAYGATFVCALLDAGWTPGPVDRATVRAAARRAAGAAALVLDRREFGFPEAREIDDALAAKIVRASPS